MIPNTLQSDREADAYELSFHRRSAQRGFVIGGALVVIASLIFLATGWLLFAGLVLPGVLLLTQAWTHRAKGNTLAARMRGAVVEGARGWPVLVQWTDGAVYRGLALQVQGHRSFVQFENGRHGWVPAQCLRQA